MNEHEPVCVVIMGFRTLLSRCLQRRYPKQIGQIELEQVESLDAEQKQGREGARAALSQGETRETAIQW